MKYESKAIALTYIKQGETSIISKLFTEKKGLQTFIIKGVRKNKSKKKLLFFEPLKLVTINAIYNPKNTLQYLTDITLEKTLKSLKSNLFNTFVATFIAEVMSKVIQYNEKNQNLFIFLWETSVILSNNKNVSDNYTLVFMLNLSKYLGFYPSSNGIEKPFFNLEKGEFSNQSKNLNICLDKKNSSYLKSLLKNEQVNIPKKERSLLLKKLLHYYKIHHYNLSSVKSHLIIESLRK